MTRRIVLLCAYILVASASFCGFFAKYALRDDSPNDSIVLMLDGTADRPYVYRQLLPAIANLTETAIPQNARNRFLAHLALEYPKHNTLAATFVRAIVAANPQYALRYYVVYALTFASLLAAMFMLRLLCLAIMGNEVAATLAPLALAIVLPAGNFWDFPELLFMTTAIWLIVKGKLRWLIPLTLVATLNKESFLFFAISIYPIFRLRLSQRSAMLHVASCVAVSALVNLFTKLRYASNPGDVAQFHLMTNLRFLIDPRNYFLSEYTYGILLPKGFNIIILSALFVVTRAGWRMLPRAARQHCLIACAINLPLYLLFGWGDEVRALSMLDVSAALLLCGAIAGYVARAYRRASVAAPQAVADGQVRAVFDWSKQ